MPDHSLNRRLALALAGLGAVGLAGRAAAQGATVSSAVELARRADALAPGDWVWAPAISPRGPVTVYVDLGRQLATVYRNGVRIGVSTVSSGKPGHETPTGAFTILQKDVHHRSSSYNNAPMPYAERLTWDGVALHAGGLPGYPESHGCVHLPMEFAKQLFGVTEMGGLVIIAGAAGRPVMTEAAGVLSPRASGEASSAAEWTWTPEASPTGPISLVVSRASKRLVVLRNGVEIGSSAMDLTDDGDFATHALTLAEAQDGSRRWIYLDVPGHAGEAGQPLDASVAARVRMPQEFQRHVESILTPGVTVLVTSARLEGGSTGARTTVMATDGAP